MIKYSILTLSLAIICISCKPKPQEKWSLVWQDEFNGDKIDTTYWTKIERGTADWNRHMSSDESLYSVQNGNLILRGKVNDNPSDTARYVTGGVYTKDKFTTTYGKIEIRAKLGSATGAWPAFWMLPNEAAWPKGGEIDIMEHLNYDSIAYQTIHTYYTYVLKEENPPKGGTSSINVNDYNTYALEWYADSLVLTINDKKTFSYPKIETTKEGQWPFTTPFYILLDMQLGGSWVGAVNPEELPVQMEIDWVKVYKENEQLK